mgnify:CR=1 FL=1
MSQSCDSVTVSDPPTESKPDPNAGIPADVLAMAAINKADGFIENGTWVLSVLDSDGKIYERENYVISVSPPIFVGGAPNY